MSEIKILKMDLKIDWFYADLESKIDMQDFSKLIPDTIFNLCVNKQTSTL